MVHGSCRLGARFGGVASAAPRLRRKALARAPSRWLMRSFHEHGRDSHPRRRPRPAQHRLGRDRGRGDRGSAYVACGSIHTDAATSLAERLALIHRALARLVEDERPAEAAVEETFVNRDPQSTLKLGQARGVALAALALDGPAGRRIRGQSDQEDGRRRRPRREGAGGDDGQDAAAREPGSLARRRRRAGGRHLPRAAPRARGAQRARA